MPASAVQGATLTWLVLDKNNANPTELKALLASEKDSAHLTLDGEVGNLKIAVTCTDPTFKGIYLEAKGKLTEGGKAIFTGCKVYKKAPLTEEYKCTVKSPSAATGTIETGELKGELVLIESELQAKIEAKTGLTGNLATLRFEGSECVLTELNQIHGDVYIKDCEGFARTHKPKHLIESNGNSTNLYIGGHSAKQLEVTKILGSAWVKLANDGIGSNHLELDWSGMDAP